MKTYLAAQDVVIGRPRVSGSGRTFEGRQEEGLLLGLHAEHM